MKVRCMESLQDKSDKEIKLLLGNAREEEVRRLCCAIQNLKIFTGQQLQTLKLISMIDFESFVNII